MATPTGSTPSGGLALPTQVDALKFAPRQRLDSVGYISSPFPAKATQQAQVAQTLTESGFMPAELVNGEVDWFYNSLGIDNAYFSNETPQNISDSILGLYSAKLLAFTKHDPAALKIELEKVTTEEDCKAGVKEGAVFIHSSAAGVSAKDGPGATVEKRIDDMFIDKSTAEKAYRLESYRSAGSISSNVSQQLRCYFVTACEFPAGGATKTASGTTDIKSVSDKAFLEKATPTTIDLYQGIMDEVSRRSGPVIESFQIEDTREYRIIIGYKQGGTRRYFSALSDLYHFYGLYSTRKFVEQFANGTTIISLYLGPVPNSKAPPIEHSVQQVVREASLLYCLPDNPFFSVAEGESPHAVQEATYAYVCWIFAQHFCNRLGPAYAALKDVLDDNNPDHADVLAKIKTRFREETFTRELIRDVIQTHPELVRLLYINFAMVHYPAADEASQLTPTLSFQRIKTVQPLSDQDLYAKIKREATNSRAAQVLEACLIFNKHVLKCNFYQPTKVALSFRLDPNFLPDIEYPKKPFGIFFFVSSDMRGFHVRFRDVARGGIRLVRSRNQENWAANVRNLFDENYNLAYTQTLKNKDIPEGGSKGTILPSLGADYEVCFEKYIDSLIDLLIPGQSPGIKGPIVDVSGRDSPEVLFLGPDEGTAEMMDWAALHAKKRGAPWWRGFTTGKSNLLGGVPHDRYGMTSLSVRQYVLGVLKTYCANDKVVTKLQSGGPDGDLGSNEILLSSEKERTVGIIDGSGVIYDPKGLDRAELVRLARARKMIIHFDESKLGPEGYKVLVDQSSVKLPSGEVVDGLDFRNTFHLRVKCDLFVPCGGRPEAVNITNVNRLVDADGKPNFKYIVEGANLFFSQQARFFMEKKGVVHFKDSSTNKGGVTSSSLEVLTGLALNDAEYAENMSYTDKPSPFYQAYVKEVQQKICENAAAEFNCIQKTWNSAKGTKSRTAISDELSQTLNKLQDSLEHSDLYDNEIARRNVLKRAFPSTLQEKLGGIDNMMARLEPAYLKAAWSAYVSSHFVYESGLDDAGNVAFFKFFTKFGAQ
ncbi:NAD-dependent glutamate dehydrogenase [Cutaneotrichosporon oleaginosum]|uniref:NAD-specific glutamate dehydrogenase n=1 Tax=Cutaneotrichosporon oleaginosum TaxID=879819 RepID=A0A0J0XXG3_9TREE|nr:NAD-dependent glutamate dehydrogenase [Cutaneotrichosporon oleaginosum]KLT45755.1 NAD-dependent glutamate dehydrogenase [Cutaneotrichosporon oleaginosum]TXT04479.1 hypothetical protein COLE_07298 [Cutaneotrichosporon oleaginosum]